MPELAKNFQDNQLQELAAPGIDFHALQDPSPAELARLCNPENGRSRSLVLIKPHAVGYRNSISDELREAKLEIVASRHLKLTPHGAATFYAEHSSKLFFDSLISMMCEGPVLAIVVEGAGDSTFKRVREMLEGDRVEGRHFAGMRERFGVDAHRNGLHGSDSVESARREIEFGFSDLLKRPQLDPGNSP